jgi:hypothetical protein
MSATTSTKAVFNPTKAQLSKICPLSGKRYDAAHNSLGYFILICEPPAGDALRTGWQQLRRQRAGYRSGGTTS